MENNCVIKDRCKLLLALLIFSFSMCSMFGNTRGINSFELAEFQHRIKGVVTDSNNVPIQGVNVEIKGSSGGTFTNKEGVFYLEAAPSDVLILSYIGFKSLEFVVGSSVELSIVLEEDVMDLDAVTVNAGYYSVKERERTGNIAKVNAEDIELQPIVSPIEALQGRMAGVEIQQQSGVPGNAPMIRIRGQNSLRYEGNYPLYIVDGVPINSAPVEGGSNIYDVGAIGGIDPLSTLNLSNIESIEVLKDADATAIYGSRGANGVVLITSKKSTYNKKTEIETRWYSGFGKVSRSMKLLNTQQYLTLRRAALSNDGRAPDESTDYDLLLWDQNRYTDWQEVLLGKTSTITDINVAASGGNASTSFQLGGSYHKEGVIFPGDNYYQKVTGNLSLNHISKNKKLGIALSMNYGVDKNNVPATTGDSFISMALSLPPNAPELYNEDGSLHWEKWEYSSNLNNPLAAILNRTSSDMGYNIITNLSLSYKLLSGLNLKINSGYTNLTREYKGLFSKNEYRPEDRDDRNDRSTESHRARRSWIIEPQLLYTTKIGGGTINGLVGLTFQQTESKNLIISGEGFVSKALIKDMTAAEDVRVLDNTNVNYKYNAIFARLGYNWEHKYIINLTGRRDGSSRFGPDKRFANFWAIGGAWIFTEEPFVKNKLSFLSFGKLRGSYGTTGSDQIGDYGYIDAYEATPGPNGLYPTQLTNPDYSWEENRKLEVALDLGLIKDRITLGVSWYRNRSSNQLVGYPLPGMTGFASVQANLPATVQNEGWEFEVSTLNINSHDFKWQTFVNLSVPKNKLIRFPNIDQTSYVNRYRVGHPLNIQLLYEYEGIDPETGLYSVKDINADERYDYEDRKVIRNVGRKFFGGLSNNLTYKGIGLQFLWEFVGQDSYKYNFGSPGNITQQELEFFERWEEGNNHNIQKISQSSDARRAYTNYNSSNRSIVNSSFVRLKSLSLAYNLPGDVIKQVGMTGCKIFLQGQNLFTITKYNGLNMDSPGRSTMPTLRTITLGVQLNF